MHCLDVAHPNRASAFAASPSLQFHPSRLLVIHISHYWCRGPTTDVVVLEEQMVGISSGKEADPYAPLTPVYDIRADLASKMVLCDAIARCHPNPETVLDLCCGTGNSMLGHISAGRRVVGVDRSEDMLQLAEQKFQGLHPRPQLLLSDIRQINLPPDSFDLIQCLSFSLNYLSLPELDSLFIRLTSSLRIGGVFAADFLLPQRFLKHFEGLHWVATDHVVSTKISADTADDFLFEYSVQRLSSGRISTAVHHLHKVKPREIKSGMNKAGLTSMVVPAAILQATPSDRFFVLGRNGNYSPAQR